MTDLYRPGSSMLHRMPAGAKLLMLAVLALGLSLLPVSWATAGTCLGLLLVVPMLGGQSPRRLLRDLRGLVLLVVFLVGTQLLFNGVQEAASNTARVVCVLVLAQTLTRTTPVPAMVETVERGLSPLRRLGLRPERVSLAMALAMTSIGQIAAFFDQVRDAQRSRGVRLMPWSWFMPLLVLSLRHADQVGDALQARGIVED